MSATYEVTHTTRYRYEVGATLCTNLAHLLPRDTPNQRVLAAEVTVDPEPDDRRQRHDLFGNEVLHFAVERPHDHLTVTARSRIEAGRAPAPVDDGSPWEAARDAAVDADGLLLRRATPFVPDLAVLADLAGPSFPPGASLLAAVTDLTRRLHDDFTYDPTATSVSTPLLDVIEQRAGVCQDFAHLALGCLRSVGLTARYVSGYLETFPPPGQPKLVGADASHAWCAVRRADGTWLDLDPTNAAVAPAHHLTVAWGRDYGDVVPLKGVVQATRGATRLDVAVDVTRVDG